MNREPTGEGEKEAKIQQEMRDAIGTDENEEGKEVEGVVKSGGSLEEVASER
jgi:hypothetical protein